ncbi:MAG: M23 family metallopeptidase [Bacteriovoracia bacterium]
MPKWKQSRFILAVIGTWGIGAGCATPPPSSSVDLASPDAPPVDVPGTKIKNLAPLIRDAAVNATLSRGEVQDAGALLLRVELAPELAERAPNVSVSYEGREFPCFPHGPAQPGVFGVVFGIPYDHPPGPSRLEIRAMDPIGKNVLARSELEFKVTPGDYPSETLKVPPSKVNPPPEAQARIQAEMEEIRALYALNTPEKQWSGNFRMPVPGKVTSKYGARRVYNGELKSAHQGLDLRAKTGDPIRAPAYGKVVLAKDLYYTGYTVILDHGYGLLTLYAHLSALKVATGDAVRAGRVLGLAGMTGRANGPHLHWSAIIHNVKVNPRELTRLYR